MLIAVTIRAYDAQDYFRKELSKRLDALSRSGRTYYDLNQWIAVRIDMLGSAFVGIVATYLVYGHQFGPSEVGFTMSVTLSFMRQILVWVRVFNMWDIECEIALPISFFLTDCRSSRQQVGETTMDHAAN